jgi:hypothetical protein
VDEVQDCLPEEIEVFFRSAKQKCFAGDNRQRIFSPRNVLPMIQQKVQTFELHHHYRIGQEICRAADVVGKSFPSILETCNYKDAESKIEFLPCLSDEDQAAKIIEALVAQLKAYPDELLAVAGPRIEDRDYLREKLLASQIAGNILPAHCTGTANPQQRVYVANLLEIKGLEFRTIHLALMQHVYRLGKNQKRISYTAITRGKTTVSIYFTGAIPGYLEQAQVTVEPPRPRPSLEDLFPGKKGRK